MPVLPDLRGLDSAKRFIEGVFSGKSPVHAVLLYGAEGAGKSALARFLAQGWLCLSPTENGPCGECRTCQAYLRGNCADVLAMAPHGPQRLITLAHITEPKEGRKPSDPEPPAMIDFLRTMPLTASKKVVTIEDADRMNSRAANALLKTLEEPHPYARFVLTTQEIGRVLPTIVSRCVCIACELPQGIAAATALDLMAEGSPGIRERLAKHEDVYSALARFAAGLSKRPQAEALAASDEFKGIGDRLEKTGFGNLRACQAESVKLLSRLMARDPAFPPEAVHAAIESHRRLLGNANATQVFDGLFTTILGSFAEPGA